MPNRPSSPPESPDRHDIVIDPFVKGLLFLCKIQRHVQLSVGFELEIPGSIVFFVLLFRRNFTGKPVHKFRHGIFPQPGTGAVEQNCPPRVRQGFFFFIDAALKDPALTGVIFKREAIRQVAEGMIVHQHIFGAAETAHKRAGNVTGLRCIKKETMLVFGVKHSADYTAKFFQRQVCPHKKCAEKTVRRVFEGDFDLSVSV